MKVNFFFDNYFLYPIIIASSSIFLFEKGQKKTALFLLFIASLTLGLLIIRLDPFIHLWDEQFHALVAKNLLKNPLKPVLIEEPIFGVVESYWSYCKIWMHKQPLFLWQISLSMKLLGENEMAIRVPSVIMNALLVFLIYRVGRICISSKIGYYSALLFSFSYFPLEYLTGFYATDHNDIAFFFYSFASIWALIEYNSSKNNFFLIVIGLTSGAAILCKWLTGLLVYFAWFIVILKNRSSYKAEIPKFFTSLIICMCIFIPWQIYAAVTYPTEYKYAMDFNTKHIFQALEGHGGDVGFYYNALFEQFGEGFLIPPIIIISFVIMVYNLKCSNHKAIFAAAALAIYLFFTIVATKMLGYVFTIFPFFIIGLTFSIELAIKKLKLYLKKTILINVILLLCFIAAANLLFNFDKLYKHHSNKESGKDRELKIKEKQFYTAIKKYFGENKYLMFNCDMSKQSHILGIFYTDFPSFSFILDQPQIEQARKLGYKLIAIDDGKLPTSIIEQKNIIKIHF